MPTPTGADERRPYITTRSPRTPCADKASRSAIGNWVAGDNPPWEILEHIGFEVACNLLTEESGVLKGNADAAALTIFKDGKTEEFRPENVRKPGILVDVRKFPGHGAPDLTGIGAGSPVTLVAYFKRPGALNSWMIIPAPDADRTDGIVKAVNDRQVTVTVLQAEGSKDVTVALDADAAIRLDGKDSSLAQALKPGNQVSIFTPRKQTVEEFKVTREETR